MADVVWVRGLLRKGVGLCHVISGNAFLFLYLFRATRSAKYLHRAWAFARFSLSDECARETWSKPDEVRRLALSACVSDVKLTSTWRSVPHTHSPTASLMGLQARPGSAPIFYAWRRLSWHGPKPSWTRRSAPFSFPPAT